ncbi:MarR family transcriptional regulator [Pseudomonas sp. COR58]|uniref:MarR family transcriptional regulator n=1 Tax=Pseudomonas ekonensis TaxID=2842353 RepID=A0ABS6PB92_9PSED|nr:MarR family transcriptional regulator [Pseudomonas ekonensis]MBV4457738.1 MarR family transcriptional regulator [Pseudomonas ekonensis]
MKHFTPDEFKNCHLGLLLGRAALLKDRIIDTHMEPHGITAAQFKVLIIVAQYGVDTPAELCRHLSLDSGSMTRMLDRLEQKGFLIRQRSEDDRRQVRLKLTEQGQQLADRLPQIGADAMNELAGAITSDELVTLQYILKKILLAAGDSITVLRLGENNER